MELRVDEVLRYLGAKNADDARLLPMIERGREVLAACAAPRHTALRLPLELRGDTALLGRLRFESAALVRHIAGCKEAYLFAATLGAGVDRLMAQYECAELPMALVLQACAASAIECYCDAACAALARECAPQGLYPTPRFSPGYGGFDIRYQPDILRALHADCRIGLSATDSHMLTPLKSITAVVGLSPVPQPCSPHKCAQCAATGCAYRKE